MKRKISKTNGVEDATTNSLDTDKAKVRALLEMVREDHLRAAGTLQRLLKQVDQAAPYLIAKFANEADFDPAEGRSQLSYAREQILGRGLFDGYYISLEKFLDIEAECLRDAAADRDRDRERRLRGREAEAV